MAARGERPHARLSYPGGVRVWRAGRVLNRYGLVVDRLDRRGDMGGHRLVSQVAALERAGAMGQRAEVDGISGDLGLGDLGPDHGATGTDRLGARDAPASGRQVTHDRPDVL